MFDLTQSNAKSKENTVLWRRKIELVDFVTMFSFLNLIALDYEMLTIDKVNWIKNRLFVITSQKNPRNTMSRLIMPSTVRISNK